MLFSLNSKKNGCVSADKSRRDDQITKTRYSTSGKTYVSSWAKPMKAAMLLNDDPGNRDF